MKQTKSFYLASAKNKVCLELDKAVKAGASVTDITEVVNLISRRYLGRPVDIRKG